MAIIGVWNPRKRKAWKILRAFCAPINGQLIEYNKIRGARVDHHVFYGVDEQTRDVFDRVAGGKNFTYIDNGYFASKYHGNAGNPYYRITRGATQHSGTGVSDGRRFADLGIRIEPWRRDGDRVILALQSEWWFTRHRINRDEWTHHIVATVTELTGRRVEVREKPGRFEDTRSIDAVIGGAWCVVTHSSNLAVDAIVRGVPAIVLGVSAARPMAGTRIEQIIDPPRPAGRENWAGVLADNQWTRAEIEAGVAADWFARHVKRGVRRGHG